DAAKITTGVLPVARGGTNTGSLTGNRIMVSTPTAIVEAAALTNGQILIGSTGAAPVPATLTAGSGVTINNSAGGISISATGTGGTVTNVTGTAPISVATGTTTPVVSISQANTTTNGYLSSTDWNIFNNKQPHLSAGATINGIVYPATGLQTMQIPLAPVNLTDAVNKQYVDTQIATGSNQWTLNSGNVYRASGTVGVGISVPAEKIHTHAEAGVLKSALRTSWTDTTSYGEWNAYEGANFMGGLGIFGSNFATANWRNALVMTAASNDLGSIIFRTRTANTYVERMVVSNSGNVGIGTTNPSKKMHIIGDNGNDFLIEGTAIDGPNIRLKNSANNTWSLDALDVTNSRFRIITENGVSGNQERLTILESGNVGVGTSAPSEKLEIGGNVKATAYLYTSDRRLKDNIVNIANSSNKVMKLRGVEFDWKKTSEHELGFIAQEVEAVEPNLVVTSEVDGMKSVKYGNVVALLVEAFKEDHKKIEDNKKLFQMMNQGLDSRVKKMEREIASLKEENQKLRNDIELIKKHLKMK
ncbi:MAG: tail fiber domain-containing protein, partial [Bacteriovoracaceae bacterium]|nr:tail fiber domain-containing protein [Bacteriovoracaceae bacterium]